MQERKGERQARQSSPLKSGCDFKVLQHYFIFYSRVEWSEQESKVEGIANSWAVWLPTGDEDVFAHQTSVPYSC